MWPPATAAAPLHRVRSPISITTIATPMVGQEEGLSALPMTCEGVLREERSARGSGVGGMPPGKAREGGGTWALAGMWAPCAGAGLAHLSTQMTKSLHRTSAARRIGQVVSSLSVKEVSGGGAFLSDERARGELASGQGSE